MNKLKGDASVFAAAGFPVAKSRHAVRPRLSRQVVSREILNTEHPMRVCELARRIEARLGRSVCANSVYRILVSLASKGLVVRIESLKGWMPVRLGANLHLICSACGAVRPVRAPVLTDHLERLASKRNFIPRRLVIESLGLCSRCRLQTCRGTHDSMKANDH